MLKCKKASIVYGASSVLWGILGFYVSSVFAFDIIAELHTNSAPFVGLDVKYMMINTFGQKITSLKGIEYFSHITDLACEGNRIANLDVTKNGQLTTLSCGSNQLT